MVEDSKHSSAEVQVPPALAARLVGGEINLAEFVGLKRETLYAIAQVGYQFLNSGKVEQARQIYRGLVAADPYDSVFHCHLAAAHHRLGDLDQALEEYTHALRFNFANTDALAGRSEIYLQHGRIAEALRDLRAAIELDPQGQKATTMRARAILVALRHEAQQHRRPSSAVRSSDRGDEKTISYSPR